MHNKNKHLKTLARFKNQKRKTLHWFGYSQIKSMWWSWSLKYSEVSMTQTRYLNPKGGLAIAIYKLDDRTQLS